MKGIMENSLPTVFYDILQTLRFQITTAWNIIITQYKQYKILCTMQGFRINTIQKINFCTVYITPINICSKTKQKLNFKTYKLEKSFPVTDTLCKLEQELR